MSARTTLRRWHLWLGWLVAVPFLLWTLSGLVMVWRPIEEVRGSDLWRPVPPLSPPDALVPPPPVPGLTSLTLEPRAGGARWIARVGNTARMADPATGRWLPPLSAAGAMAEVASRWQGARLVGVDHIFADAPPADLRKPLDGWRVRTEDGTHIYVEAGSGAVVATRTRWWRFYDWMWGLHIMDPRDREDTHHPILVASALAAVAMTLLALILLPLATRWKSLNRRG